MIPKTARKVDRALLDSFRGQACAVLGTFDSHMGPVVAHHIKTRGSGGDDVEKNLVPLCSAHHSEIHQLGVRRFIEKNWISPASNRKLRAWLARNPA